MASYKAQDQITLTDLTDVKAQTTLYFMQLSTKSKPKAPPTNKKVMDTSGNKDVWTLTEPSYVTDDTYSLYTCEETEWNDGSITFGMVQLSSSYEASKQAYNKAVDVDSIAKKAQSTADAAQSKADSAGSAAGAAGTAAKQAAVQADQAKTDAANARNAANKVNVKFSSLIRKTDDGIECGMVPDASTLSEGSSITVPAALVNANGSFDVLLVTYTNSSGTVTKTASGRIATFGKNAVIGKSTETHAHIDSDSFDIVDADGYLKASLGGSTPMVQIGKFTFVNRENGNLTLRLNEEG